MPISQGPHSKLCADVVLTVILFVGASYATEYSVEQSSEVKAAESPSLELTTSEAAMGCTPGPNDQCEVAIYRGMSASIKGSCFGAYPNLTQLTAAGVGFSCPKLPSSIGSTCIGTACDGGHCAPSAGSFTASHSLTSKVDWQQFAVLGVRMPDPSSCGYTLFKNISKTYAMAGAKCVRCGIKNQDPYCTEDYIPKQTCYIEKYTRVAAAALQWKVLKFEYIPHTGESQSVMEVHAECTITFVACLSACCVYAAACSPY